MTDKKLRHLVTVQQGNAEKFQSSEISVHMCLYTLNILEYNNNIIMTQYLPSQKCVVTTPIQCHGGGLKIIKR